MGEGARRHPRLSGYRELLEYDYTPGYYAVFCYDPDGIKLELLHRPGYWDWLRGGPGDR